MVLGSILSFGVGVMSSIAAWALSIAILSWLEVRFTFRRAQNIVDDFAANLISDGFNPDYILAIDRNSTILGTLLAGQLGLRTVISVATENRRNIDGSRAITLAEGYLCNLDTLAGKNLLVFIAFNNSRTSLQLVYDHLQAACGAGSDIRTAAFYSSPSPRMIPRYVALKSAKRGERSAIRLMDKMPWATKSWKRALREERH